MAVYPEWLQIKDSWGSKAFTVTDTFYKGIYEELAIERNGVVLRTLNLSVDKFPVNSKIHIQYLRHLEFDEE